MAKQPNWNKVGASSQKDNKPKWDKVKAPEQQRVQGGPDMPRQGHPQPPREPVSPESADTGLPDLPMTEVPNELADPMMDAMERAGWSGASSEAIEASTEAVKGNGADVGESGVGPREAIAEDVDASVMDNTDTPDDPEAPGGGGRPERWGSFSERFNAELTNLQAEQDGDVSREQDQAMRQEAVKLARSRPLQDTDGETSVLNDEAVKAIGRFAGNDDELRQSMTKDAQEAVTGGMDQKDVVREVERLEQARGGQEERRGSESENDASGNGDLLNAIREIVSDEIQKAMQEMTIG